MGRIKGIPFKDLRERFESKFKINEATGCWEWLASKNDGGYGVFGGPDGKNVMAHRFSFEFYKGIKLGNLKACHSCDNPSCVNPDHLFAGTQKDNMQDAINKGRFIFPPRIRTAVHPSVTHYIDYKCRCSECTTLMREYQKRFRKPLKRQPFVMPDHPSVYHYKIAGCRCADCRELARLYAKNIRDKKRLLA
jgi:hypothetical protein